jgi:hypothetical protein
MLTRRGLLKGTVVMMAAPAEVKILDRVALTRFDFESGDVTGWTTVAGTWTVEEMDGAPSGRRVLVQRSTGNAFNVIVAPPGPFSDVDASVKFKPISGREDASGGIVVRFDSGRYYVVRANALEDNLRLYHYDHRRHQLATADVKAPALGQWHTLRILAVGDHLQSWLDGRLRLDHHDTRSRAGQVGLWTKADSITAFDDLSIRGS